MHNSRTTSRTRRALVAGTAVLGLSLAGTGVASAAVDLPSSSAGTKADEGTDPVQSVVTSLENWYNNTDILGSLTSIAGSALTGGSTAGSWMYLLPSTGH
ncbi:MAG: hypothetical protein L0K27_11870 [Corynebacterium nuruki]|jgi:hypothetical protein|nr:hypothetical protein [Corynebacterium nuruki]